MFCPRFTSPLFHVVSCLSYRYGSPSFLVFPTTFPSAWPLSTLRCSRHFAASSSPQFHIHSAVFLFHFRSTFLLDSPRLIASSLLYLSLCLPPPLFLCAVLFIPFGSPRFSSFSLLCPGFACWLTFKRTFKTFLRDRGAKASWLCPFLVVSPSAMCFGVEHERNLLYGIIVQVRLQRIRANGKETCEKLLVRFFSIARINFVGLYSVSLRIKQRSFRAWLINKCCALYSEMAANKAKWDLFGNSNIELYYS